MLDSVNLSIASPHHALTATSIARGQQRNAQKHLEKLEKLHLEFSDPLYDLRLAKVELMSVEVGTRTKSCKGDEELSRLMEVSSAQETQKKIALVKNCIRLLDQKVIPGLRHRLGMSSSPSDTMKDLVVQEMNIDSTSGSGSSQSQSQTSDTSLSSDKDVCRNLLTHGEDFMQTAREVRMEIPSSTPRGQIQPEAASLGHDSKSIEASAAVDDSMQKDLSRVIKQDLVDGPAKAALQSLVLSNNDLKEQISSLIHLMIKRQSVQILEEEDRAMEDVLSKLRSKIRNIEASSIARKRKIKNLKILNKQIKERHDLVHAITSRMIHQGLVSSVGRMEEVIVEQLRQRAEEMKRHVQSVGNAALNIPSEEEAQTDAAHLGFSNKRRWPQNQVYEALSLKRVRRG
ncbi:hypothetical protein D9757_006385 [Collybiopsis confluens]|uniref:Uncharacterized protein n=1 Tax=Collybiopsis confluens TaxID=2823264 RepID=A0A8H5HGY4_9AGAR|nr:hypothetical protein D9757_006385 [Collybiopsis confluens]